MSSKENNMTCPECGGAALVKSYGPFFTPDPVYRFSVTCIKSCWRGKMCASKKEAIECYDELAPHKAPRKGPRKV